ncbi:MAG: inorganic diphosphatase [Pseudolabrys sp.]|nr:inorganic diphosphatase [Pseudolabrys sp.]
MRVFIENEAGSRAKNIYDDRSLVFQRTVEVSRAYPFPYGFVIGTRSGDGDCVDCFVLTGKGLPSGSTVECDVVGLLEQVEDGEVDHKVLAVLAGETATLDDALAAKLRDFVRGVFAHVPGKRMEIGRLLGRAEAEAYIRACPDNTP